MPKLLASPESGARSRANSGAPVHPFLEAVITSSNGGSILTDIKSLSTERKSRKTNIQHKIATAVMAHHQIDEDDEEDAGKGHTNAFSKHPKKAGKKTQKPDKANEEVVTFEESPYYVLKLAAQGNVADLHRLVTADASKLATQDFRGQNIVHHAAQWSRIHVLDYLNQYVDIGLIDLNDLDKLGNTPMHFAIGRGQMASLDWLLAHGADMKIKNILNLAPIHLAVELGHKAMIERILDEDPDMVHYPGDLGFTPLMFACRHDRPEIARLLLDNDADLMHFCDIGYSAIHCATKNGCSKIVDVLIEYGEKRGISRKKLIHTTDKENNLPLHAAVNSGDIKAVEVCLEAGADICALQPDDKQTSIHYAAAKGALNLLKVMFEAQPDKIHTAVRQRDILEQTPLQKAAMLNHLEVVEYLIDMGANINTQDDHKRTPLISAASKNALKVVNYLLQRGANTFLRDSDHRNFLHIAVLNGMKLRGIQLQHIGNVNMLLDQRDDFGCTVAHYASQAGQLATLNELLALGAQVIVLNKLNQNPLHTAAQHGRLQTCLKLLRSDHSETLVSEIDNDGYNVVHVAAAHGHARIIAAILNHGGQLLKDNNYNTPLHLAAEKGHFEAVTLLLTFSGQLLNQTNRFGNTALHLAASNNHALVVDYLLGAGAELTVNEDGETFFDLAIIRDHTDVCAAVIRHQRGDECMRLDSVFGQPIIGLIIHVPNIVMIYMDKCVNFSDESRKSYDYHVNYNFEPLLTPEHLRGLKFEKVGRVTPLWALNTMVRYNRTLCLSHPLCVTFLDQKWSAYGSVLYNIRVLLYLVCLLIVTSITFDGDRAYAEYIEKRNQHKGDGGFEEFSMDLLSNGLLVRMIIVTAFSVVNLISHALNLKHAGISYFFEFTNYIEVIFFLSILVLTLPSFIGYPSTAAQYVSSAICMFFGWVNLLFQMQRFNFFGLYIVMFQEILTTLIRALIVFSIILMAFALSMTLAFKRMYGPDFSFLSPDQSFITILPMLWGDVNYEEYIVSMFNKRGSLLNRTLNPGLTYAVFLCFTIIMSILTKNLLIGLAVGNIESVQKNAALKRRTMQVIFFTDLEQQLPNSFLKVHNVFNYQYFPNRKVSYIERLKKLFGSGNVGRAAATVEVGGNSADLDDEAAEIQYIHQELSLHSRRLASLAARYELHRQLMRIISRRFDEEVFGNETKEREVESADDADNAQQESNYDNDPTIFRSAAASAQWHAINKRLANMKKPKTNIWVAEDEDGDKNTAI